MKIIFFLVLNLFLLLSINFPQTVLASQKEVLDGLNDIYNLKFESAESKFLQMQRSDPEDLIGYFYESLLYFYKALPTRDEKMFEKYINKSDRVIKKAEDILDKNENDPDALYYKGLSHSYQSLLMLSLNRSLLEAASNGNDGYRILTSLIEKYPDYYDAYMGLGLYKIALGFVPENFKWLLSLIGFQGNIKEGIDFLNISLNKGKYTRVDSKVFLSIFSIREKEDRNDIALNFSRELTEQYPESPVFRILYSSLLLQYGRPEEAITSAETALSLNKYSLQSEIVKSANAVFGAAYFRISDYKSSIPALEGFMKLANKEDRYNVYLFTLGIAYELTGDRNKAIENYKKARNVFNEERDGELDNFFYRLALEKIDKPVNEFDKVLIKGMNLRDTEKPLETIDLYNEFISSGKFDNYDDDDYKIKFYYEFGLSYFYNKDLDNAEKYFKMCIKLNPENETWLIPHSYFELGKIYNKKVDKVNSEKMFEKIYDYDDFDFESFLEMRLANYKNK